MGTYRKILLATDFSAHARKVAAEAVRLARRHQAQLHVLYVDVVALEGIGTFADADEVMILDIYPSRETDSLGVSAADLRRLVPGSCHAAGRPGDAVATLAACLRGGDVVITLGAGDVTIVGPALLDGLRERMAG